MLGKQREFLLSLFCLPSVYLTLFHSVNVTSLHCQLVKGCLKEMVHKNFIKGLGGNGKSSKSVKTSYSCPQVRQLATLVLRKPSVLSDCYQILEPISSSEDLCSMQGVWVHCFELHSSLCAQPALGEELRAWTDAAFASAAVRDQDPVTPATLCALSLTDLQPEPSLSRGLGVGERLPLAIPRAAFLEYTRLLLPNICKYCTLL